MGKNILKVSQTGFYKFEKFCKRFDTSSWSQLALLAIVVLLVVGFMVAIFAFFILWPFALAWAINSIFATHIPYTFGTWIAFIVIGWVCKLITGR